MIRPPQAAPDTGVRRVPGNGSPTLQQSAPAQTAPQVAPQPIARDNTGGKHPAPTDAMIGPRGRRMHAATRTGGPMKRIFAHLLIALGTLAERLDRQPLDHTLRFLGFLATPRNGKGVVFHLQEFQHIS